MWAPGCSAVAARPASASGGADVAVGTQLNPGVEAAEDAQQLQQQQQSSVGYVFLPPGSVDRSACIINLHPCVPLAAASSRTYAARFLTDQVPPAAVNPQRNGA